MVVCQTHLGTSNMLEKVSHRFYWVNSWANVEIVSTYKLRSRNSTRDEMWHYNIGALLERL